MVKNAPPLVARKNYHAVFSKIVLIMPDSLNLTYPIKAMYTCLKFFIKKNHFCYLFSANEQKIDNRKEESTIIFRTYTC